MNRFYKTTEHNSVCVWDGRTGKCMGTFALYGDPGSLRTNNVTTPDAADDLINQLNEVQS